VRWGVLDCGGWGIGGLRAVVLVAQADQRQRHHRNQWINYHKTSSSTGKSPNNSFSSLPNPNRSHKAGGIPCNNTKNPVPHPVATETSGVCISISSCDRRERCPATHRRTDWRFAETMQQARRAQKKMKKRGMPMRREMPRRRLAAGIVGGWGWW